MDGEGAYVEKEVGVQRDWKQLRSVPAEMHEEEEMLARMLAQNQTAGPVSLNAPEASAAPQSYTSLLKSIDYRRFLLGIYGLSPTTPEEDETLKYCRSKALRRVGGYAAAGFVFNALINYSYRHQLRARLKAANLLLGSSIGAVYGICASTKPTAQMFLALGPEYPIGALVMHDFPGMAASYEKQHGPYV